MEGKKRSTNFSTKEELLLINLVRKLKNTIESKKTDTMTNKSKAAAWNDLAKEYNSTSGESYGDMRILKSKYENLKKTSKRKYAEEKCFITGTGGGPLKDIKVTIIDEQIKELLGNRLLGFLSEFDDHSEVLVNAGQFLSKSTTGDIIIFDPLDETNKPDNDIVAIPGSSNEIIPVAQSKDWSDYTPQMLRTPKAVPLRTKVSQHSSNSQEKENFINKRTPAKDKISAWVTVKMKLAEKQLLLLEGESKKKIEIMEQESLKKLEYMEKEHLLKMQILAAELQNKQK